MNALFIHSFLAKNGVRVRVLCFALFVFFCLVWGVVAVVREWEKSEREREKRGKEKRRGLYFSFSFFLLPLPQPFFFLFLLESQEIRCVFYLFCVLLPRPDSVGGERARENER